MTKEFSEGLVSQARAVIEEFGRASEMVEKVKHGGSLKPSAGRPSAGRRYNTGEVSAMPSLWQVVIPIGVALTAVAVTAWINIHIRFALTREAAVQDLKQSASRIIPWLFRWSPTALTVFLLIRNVNSPAPVTRDAVFTIALQVACLALVVVMIVMTHAHNRLTKAILTLLAAHDRHIEVTQTLVDAKGPDHPALKE